MPRRKWRNPRRNIERRHYGLRGPLPREEAEVTTTPPDQRQRRRLVFRHVSAHPTRSDAFQFYGAVSSIAWQRETVEVLSDGREIEQRPDGLHVLTLTFSYGPVI